MGKVRVMFIGQGPSGLAEDRVVNTFHFEGAGAFDAGDLQATTLIVAAFYNGTNSTRTVASYLSPWVNRTAELRAYNLEEAEPRTPYITPLDLGAPQNATGLPEEVAVCITLHGAPPNTPRRRGRLYLGPLTTGSSTAASNDDASRPLVQLQQDVAIACTRMIDDVTSTLNWSIRSTTPTENFVPIVSGYIDNAFDTQRRRGPDATSRYTFTSTP